LSLSIQKIEQGFETKDGVNQEILRFYISLLEITKEYDKILKLLTSSYGKLLDALPYGKNKILNY
jgi:hypothetical protein